MDTLPDSVKSAMEQRIAHFERTAYDFVEKICDVENNVTYYVRDYVNITCSFKDYLERDFMINHPYGTAFHVPISGCGDYASSYVQFACLGYTRQHVNTAEMEQVISDVNPRSNGIVNKTKEI